MLTSSTIVQSINILINHPTFKDYRHALSWNLFDKVILWLSLAVTESILKSSEHKKQNRGHESTKCIIIFQDKTDGEANNAKCIPGSLYTLLFLRR